MMQDADHKAQRVNLARWAAEQILKLYTDAPQVKGKGEIKKESMYFVEKF